MERLADISSFESLGNGSGFETCNAVFNVDALPYGGSILQIAKLNSVERAAQNLQRLREQFSGVVHEMEYAIEELENHKAKKPIDWDFINRRIETARGMLDMADTFINHYAPTLHKR